MLTVEAFLSAANGEGPPVELETSGFKLSYGLNRRAGRPELTLISTVGAGHRAIHSNYIELDDDGSVIDHPLIGPDVAAFIYRNFDRRGHTESFTIPARALAHGEAEAALVAPKPEDVRHQLGTTEKSFTATGAKLAAHWPIFHKLRDTGFSSIIRATMTNSQVCASRCHFCSTIARNKKDSITLEEAKRFVTTLYDEQAAFNREQFPEYNEEYRRLHGCDIRLRGLILSGGGQPNLWPHFVEFVRWLSERDIDLGLITNGFPQSIPEDIYTHFKWVRISVTPPEASAFYPGGMFEKQYIPATLKHNPAVTVGLSYVDGPWSDDAILLRLDRAAVENGFEYVRVLTDCNLGRSAQLLAHHHLAEKLFRTGLVDAKGQAISRTFQQLKYHGTEGEALDLWSEGQCYLQSYNVFWDTTGHDDNGHSYCYPCDSVTVLTEEGPANEASNSERRFNASKWGTVRNDQVEKLYREPLRAYFDPREICHACLFMRNNATVKSLANAEDYSSISVPKDLQHQNFP
ncbi:hypothetical protein [Niveispirillum sp. BGYR6]|uniref:hypothetical protein n=1 Tax=Niveispirillum sp. BGYR6 TaxID=2971249 RepID=UPI0022B9CDB4|nr:hypothetical protein [Niveispirillum sp. BGYR6]MDG5496778.1 hypothetical protein [Niveispirillum sp. BGYR6]